MEVTCTRCGTEYEFEEAVISPGGMTVKCTDCGHLFKVQREPEPAEEPAGPDSSGWMIRHGDGRVSTLDSFADITVLIRDLKVNPDAELSRTGRAWKRLGDIEELAGLFPDQAGSPPPPPRPRRVTPDLGLAQRPPPAAARDAGGRTSDPPPAPRSAATTSPSKSNGDGATAAPRPSTGITTSPAPKAEPGHPAEPRTPEADDSAVTGRMPRQLPDTLDPADELARRSGRPLRWLAILLPLAFAGWGALWLIRDRSAPAEVRDPTRQDLALALSALDSHRTDRFEQAIAGFERTLAHHPDDPHVLSGLSRVYAVWSQDRRFELDALPPRERAHAKAAEQARKLAAQAKAHAERAAQRNPGHEGAGVALADALRLSGNLVGARAELDRARANEGVPEAETLRVAALLAADEAGGDMAAGRSLAEQAVAQDPESIRARELLAYCLIAEGDFEGARLHADAIAAIAPGHPVLARLENAMRRARRRATEEPQPEPARAAVEAAPASPREPVAQTSPATRRAKEPDAPSTEELIRSGEAALERGATQQATRLFQQALAADPNSARARTGLGYVALEKGQPGKAIRRFKPAMAQGHPEAYIGLGDAYRRLGRMREALTAYKGYLRRFPKGQARSIAKRQVELLEEQIAEASSMSGDAPRDPGDSR